MSNLTTKQKIVIGVIIIVMIVIIGIYGYSIIGKDNSIEQDILISDENMQNEPTKMANENIIDSTKENGTTASMQENSDLTEKEENSNINGYENLEGKIVIHMTGAIQKTGIIILPEGARIADAIDASGGTKENADLDEVNLAYILQDGQKVYIPKKGDKTKLEKKVYITSESGNNVIVETVNSDKKGGNSKVNINSATQEELESLPGIGSSIASKIIEYREQNGKFSKIEDLQNVKGIGEAKFNKMKEYIIVK